MAYNKKFYENKGELDKWRDLKNRHKYRYRQRTGSFKYGRRRWTNEEIELLFNSDLTDRELGEKIQRSVSAIQTRRSSLKQKE